MFICEFCGQITQPGTKMNRVVAETRQRTYQTPSNREVQGWEIVREIPVGPCCMEEGRFLTT